MAVLWSAAINAARDFSPAFDRQSTPDIVALRQGARYQQGLLAAIAETKLDRVHVVQSIPLPLTRFDQGVELNPYIRVHGATAYTTDAPEIAVDVEIVEYPERLDASVAGLRMPDRLWPPTWLGQPSAYIAAGFFKLLGTATDWISIARIEVDLFPTGPDDVKLTDALVLPGQPLRACVADLAAFMGLRAGVAMPDPSGARESYLDEVTERRRVKVGTIREVW